MEKTDKENFERLKATRRGHRSVTTRLTKEALDLINDDSNIEAQSRLKTIATLLEGKLAVLKDLDDKILGLCALSDVEYEIEESGEIELKIIECKDKIFRNQNKTKSETISQTSSVVSDLPTPTGVETHTEIEATTGNPTPIIMQQQQTQPFQATQVKAKLPKITLPKFKGNVTNWTSFWESFRAAVHDNNSISKVDKFNYLYSLLEGSAVRAIQGLTLTEANYSAAIQILEERFGRTQQIISAHMDELFKIQPCSNERSSSIRFVYDKIRVHVRGLDSLGVASEQYGSLLIPIVMSKLPSSMRLQVARKSTSEVWKIDELLETIRKEVEAREASDQVKLHERKSPPPSERNKNLSPTAQALLAKQGETSIRCAYCNDHHYSASCEKVKRAQDRKDILRRDGRCFICLRSGHFSHECSNTKGCRNCNQRHHQSICSRSNRSKSDPPKEKTTSQQQTSTDETPANTTTTTAASTTPKGKTVLLQTARCIATNEDNSKSTAVRVLFDNGSQRTYITNSLKSRLKLKPIKKEMLRLNTFGDDRVRKESCDVVKCSLRQGNGERVQISALSFPVICSSLPLKVEVNKYPHIEGLTLADEYGDQDRDSIDVLIGSDCYWDVVTGETLRGDFGPTAVNSKLGWLLSGPLEDVTTSAADTYVSNLIISGDIEERHHRAHQDDELTSTLKKFWETESIGVREFEDPDNRQPPKPFLKNISYKNNRYEVRLPWKEEMMSVAVDYNHCYNRLRSMQYKLRQEPELLEEYNNTIQEQIDKGVVEEVPPEDVGNLHEQASDTGKSVHYLPHHAVVRKDKDTTKLRVVYDGSAKSDSEGRSLNDFLETGPNFIPHLFDVLIRFRWNPVAVSADIEKAFLMVGINPSDRDMLRFLWLKEPEKLNSKIKHLRFCRLVFGLRPSPAILGATIHHHLNTYQDQYPELIELIKKSLYVDDFLSGASNDSQAFDIYRKSKEVMKEGGFNLRKWHSNSASVMKTIDESESSEASSTSSERKVTTDDESYIKSTIGSNSPSQERSVKVLGVHWNTCSDELFFNFDELVTYARSLPITKRTLLKLTAKIFDPLGFLSPFTIQLKSFFQVICSKGSDWDEELEGKARMKFNSFVSDLQHLADVRIPRCYFDTRFKPNNIQLHGFSDASQQAFAAVVYMRSTYDNGHVEVNLIASKTKVAPTKKQTIPRLELLGALILARLVAAIRRSLSLPQDLQTIYWVDSITALYWIRNSKCWKQYVEHRVQEIRQLSVKEEWRFCPGSQNPADLPSRGLDGKELARNRVWWKGPEFLTQSDEEWPVNPVYGKIPETAMEEIVKNPQTITHSFSSLDPRIPVVNINNIISCNSFSTLPRLLRITAYVLRFVQTLKEATRGESSNTSPTTSLTATEISQAESLWVRTVQMLSFEKELDFLENNLKCCPPTYVVQFGLLLDDRHILRCRGRINNAMIPQSYKNPILLPSKHHFSDLVIRDTHEKVKHSGIRQTLVTLRERFWVLRGREAVKRNLRRCVICRKHEGPSYNPPPTPDLPSERVSAEPPFTYTGLDFAGPLYVRHDKETAPLHDHDSTKVHVCLFTCASTRAVHLELTQGLSVQSFLMAFRRFTSRRGLPCTLISDNAKTFRSASKDVQALSRSEEVLRYLANNHITWSFIVEKAPWWGGFWERLIKGLKRCLKKTIGRSTLTYHELNTVLIEIEGVLNARPITYVYDDEESVSHPLTPSHLINGRRLTSMPNSEHFEIISTNQVLTKRAKHQRKLLQQFTSQWQREYLLSLRENAIVKSEGKGRSNKANVSVGDIVLIKSASTKRAFWKLGRVEELLAGRDGQIRAARVKVANGGRNPISIRRVIQHLIPLEARSSDVSNSTNGPTNAITENLKVDETADKSARPRRKAALLGESIRRLSNMH